MSCYLLLVFLLPLLLMEVDGESTCTEGFMDLDLIQYNMNYPAGSLSVSTLAEKGNATRWIIIEGANKFTCDTVATLEEILIGVDIRTVNDTIDRNLYPRFDVWSRNSNHDYYTRQMSVDIILTPDNFTTNGLYRYRLPQLVNVYKDYRIGVYQPPSERSVVRFYKITGSGKDFKRVGKIPLNLINSSVIKIKGDNKEVDEQRLNILLHPVTGCFEQVVTERTLNTSSLSITRIIPVTDTRVFPDIHFTCTGIITNGLVGHDGQGTGFPVVKIRRSTNLTTTALRVNITNAVNISRYVYNIPVSNEVIVQPGDILMIECNATSRMYYQKGNGPFNYRLGENDILTRIESNDYPLISVIIQPATATASNEMSYTVTDQITTSINLAVSSLSTFTTTTDVIQMTTTTYSSVSITSSTTTTVTTTSGTVTPASITSSTTTSDTVTPTLQGSTSNNNMTLIGIISTVLLLLVVIILVILIVSILMYKRRKRLTLKVSSGEDASHAYIDTSDMRKDEGMSPNPTYQAQITLYDEPGQASDAITDMSNPNYGASEGRNQGIGSGPVVYEELTTNRGQENTASQNETYSLLEGAALYVPTASERSGKGQNEDIYSTLINELYSTSSAADSTYSRLNHNGTSGSFFIEDTEYWEPDTNTDGIYQQLSDRKYREIIRHQIKVTDYLGSGQFGTVNKGVWTTPTGSVPVAIKTLTSEDERVKFLQEAAIMGQFHHPNVVKLHGVVTIGDPTMIILEFISGGDLKEYLKKFKPSPGELVLSSVPSVLLSFCRQIASGMEYLSKKKFVHRDLAARNILVSTEGTGVCKIADFGMSRDLQDESYYISQSKKIPIKWTAPEALHYKKYSSASDVWSYGAVMYEIWSLGHKPFETHTNQECVRLVDSGYRLPPPPGCPKPIYKLMIQTWNPDNTQRPTFSSILSCLSVPNEKLLIINEKSVTVLGGALETSHTLYTDLQYMYKK